MTTLARLMVDTDERSKNFSAWLRCQKCGACYYGATEEYWFDDDFIFSLYEVEEVTGWEKTLADALRCPKLSMHGSQTFRRKKRQTDSLAANLLSELQIIFLSSSQIKIIANLPVQTFKDDRSQSVSAFARAVTIASTVTGIILCLCYRTGHKGNRGVVFSSAVTEQKLPANLQAALHLL